MRCLRLASLTSPNLDAAKNWNVVDDPMDPNHLGCFRVGRVRIIDNQGETFSAIGDTLPRKWRRDILGLAGVLRGNLTILLERGVNLSSSPWQHFPMDYQRTPKENNSAGADDQNCRHARQCSCRTRHSSSCVMCGLGNRTARWTRGLTTPADSLTSPQSSDVGGAPRHVAFVPPSRLY